MPVLLMAELPRKYAPGMGNKDAMERGEGCQTQAYCTSQSTLCNEPSPFGGPLSFASGLVRLERTCNQSQSTYEQDEHHKSIEKAGWLEIDMHVGEDAAEDEQRSTEGQEPSNHALAVPKQNGHTKKQRQKSDSEPVAPPETPVRADDTYLMR